jgi:citrate lyase subunit beta / citryl-CoA lyase
VVTVVEGAGQNLDCIMLPKFADAGQVTALDLLLTQIEKTMGFEAGRIGVEAQIENARGLMNVDQIAAASPRLETIVFGPADFMASINIKSLVVGEQPPGYPDRQTIDGPYLQVRNADGFWGVPGGPPPSASTASGCCTRTRSPRPTRSSPCRRRNTTTPS